MATAGVIWTLLLLFHWNEATTLTWEGPSVNWNGHRYTFMASSLTFEEAYTGCIGSRYGKLVEIESQAEMDFLMIAVDEYNTEVAGDREYYIGVQNGAWFSGNDITGYDKWCSSQPAADKHVVLDYTNNFCWGEATVNAGALCEKTVSPKTIADFYPISYNSDCYLFSREPIFPLSTEFGEHHRAKRMCEEVGAELVKVADEPENLAILGMSNCHFAEKLELDIKDLRLVVDKDTYTNYMGDGTPNPDEECIVINGLTGKWESRVKDACIGNEPYNIDFFKTYAVCKSASVCDGQWEIVFRHKVDGQAFFFGEEALSVNSDDVKATRFSRLDSLASYRTTDSKYHLRLLYSDLGGRYNEWIQDSNPAEGNGDPISGFSPISINVEASPTKIPFTDLFGVEESNNAVHSDCSFHDKNYAIDGVFPDTNDFDYWCSPEENYGWLQVDLGSSKYIHGADVHMREDVVLRRYQDIEMRVGDTDATGTGSALLTINTPCGPPLSILASEDFMVMEHRCGTAILGRYVTLQKTGTVEGMTFDVSEIEIWERSQFLGLGKNSAVNPALMDWRPESDSDWDFSVGAQMPHKSGLRGPPGVVVSQVELLIHTYKKGDCFEFDTDLVGNDLTEHTSVPSVDDCQRVCQVEAGCTHFTYQESQLKCKTKTSDSGRTNLVAGFDSGPKYCATAFYHLEPACGFPDDADANSYLQAAQALVCGRSAAIYECNAGGINEIDGQPGLNSISVGCSSGGSFDYPVTWPVCISSFTCPLLPGPPHGKFVCDDIALLVGSSCHLICDDGYMPDLLISNTCMQDEVTLDYYWEESDHSTNNYRCVTQIGVVVGGIRPDLTYVQSVEVFAPSQGSCHGYELPDYPFRVMGSVSGIVGGRGIVCGGARDIYVECEPQSIGGYSCARNAQRATSLGNTLWINGPATRECYTYDHMDTKAWVKATDLHVGRVYAASAPLPDGTMIIVGGISEDGEILNTAEVVGRNLDGTWYSSLLQAKIPHTVFGHCLFSTADGAVYMAGGFDGSDYSNKFSRYDHSPTVGTWTVLPGTLHQARYDHSCKVTELRGEVTLMAIGGWNQDGYLNTTEFFDFSKNYWTSRGETLGSLDFELASYDYTHLRRSGVAFKISDRFYVVAGSACGMTAEDHPKCERLSSAVQFEADDVTEFGDTWNFVTERLLDSRSSFTIFGLPETLVCN